MEVANAATSSNVARISTESQLSQTSMKKKRRYFNCTEQKTMILTELNVYKKKGLRNHRE